MAPGQGSLHEAWRRARAHSREESYGRRWAWVSNAGEAAVAAVVAGACAPHGCFCNTVGSSVAQLGRSKHNGGRKRLTRGVAHSGGDGEETGRQNRRSLAASPSTLRGSDVCSEGTRAGGRKPTSACPLGLALQEPTPLSGGAPGSHSPHGTEALLPPPELPAPRAPASIASAPPFPLLAALIPTPRRSVSKHCPAQVPVLERRRPDGRRCRALTPSCGSHTAAFLFRPPDTPRPRPRREEPSHSMQLNMPETKTPGAQSPGL